MPSPSVFGLVVRIVALCAALVAIVFASFNWGKNACRATYEAATAKIRGQHADALLEAERKAAERALAAQKKDLENEERLDDIARLAEGATNADDVCLSETIVDRLRKLQ